MNNNDLRLLLHSKVALVVLETFDEPRALDMLRSVFQQEQLQAFSWSLTEGVARLGFGPRLQQPEQYCAPEEALGFIKKQLTPSAFVLCDIHPFLDEPKIMRLIKDIILPNNIGAQHRLVLLSHRVPLPPELKRYAASIKLSVPDDEEVLALIRAEASCWAKTHKAERIKTYSTTLRKLVNNLRELTHHDVRRLVRGAIADDGAITESDLPDVTRAKFELMDMEGVLHCEYSTAHLGDVGGSIISKRGSRQGARPLSVMTSRIAPKALCCSVFKAVARASPRKLSLASGAYLCCGWIWAPCLTSTWAKPSVTCGKR